MLPPLARKRGDLPAGLCAALDRAILPDPDARGELDELFDAIADALPEVSDAGGRIAPHPLERRIPALPPAIGRLVAPAAAGALVWAALAGLTPDPAVQPALGAAAAVALVALLPRAGWLLAAAATALALALGPAPRPGAALLLAALAAAPPLLLRADGRAWSLPARGACARAARARRRLPCAGRPCPALEHPRRARRARRLVARARRAVCSERALVFGPAPGTPGRASFDGAPGIAAGDVIAKACSSGALLLALVWGAAALVAPWLVRGRSLPADVVGATAWAAGLAATTAALGEWLGERVGQAAPVGLVPGAVAAAALALVLAHARRPAAEEPAAEEA